MAREIYQHQVELLVRTLPFIAKHDVFALKGGTAINLFYRDMPRLSVDIDLTYLPLQDRTTTLKGIDETLEAIREEIQSTLEGVRVTRIPGGGGGDTRVLVSTRDAEIKIETSPVARGTVHPPTIMTISEAVQEQFGFAEMPVLAFEDLFGGKLHAAVDRQHPRDLFDVKLLYENEGFTDALFRTFLVYVASSGRPPHELLKPSMKPIDREFAEEFDGMTIAEVTLDELLETRVRLANDIASRLDQNAMKFLLSLHDGVPDFESISLPQAADLPAIRWKLMNLARLKEENPEKYAEQRKALGDLAD